MKGANFFAGRCLTRADDSHKGDYGRLLVVAGCQRMPGAALLATGAALRSGCGVVTLHSTERALLAAVTAYPSAKLSEDPGVCFSLVPPLEEYDAIAVGPGLGQAPATQSALLELFRTVKEWNEQNPAKEKKLVLDADALNALALRPETMTLLPQNTILTPHWGELGRLLQVEPSKMAGDSKMSADPRMTDASQRSGEQIVAFCQKTNCILVKKGPHTGVYTSDGLCYENTTGNPGLAKGGSGDVLTGLIGGLLARGYDALLAAELGVWIHGAAGDFLTQERTAEAWDASDLVSHLWVGFKCLSEEVIYNNRIGI